ncbi:Hsp33 family molecular chaperone HslO [Methylobacter sp. S3L5C]|uniref:Hsp33 family molecular chaperone HslO n=1 Tax=Methylobacter sp. S3L5C TaxID=2839024 RepID=UPI001FAC1A24|nr:Hsp33 family molecular chaperone HslO [Methylobacter sp. S3L5C]UOA06833.1 Hsp33 family molecular chaperone HslO [Methylobacter sp. S3L5C]
MIEQDLLRRFIFEDLGVRGEWVKLTTSWQGAKQHQQGPENAQLQLGQALAAVVMLSATVKFKGSMILQAQGDGDFKTLVAQSTDDQKIRGLIRSNDHIPDGSLETMFGQGRLVLTIEPDNAQPYQGVVPLEGSNLADALQVYFEQSEQLKTRLWLFANATHAVGLLIQELPSQDNEQDDWERIEILANTVTEQELLELDCEDILYKLFNAEEVRLFDAEPVKFECVCSRPRIERTLRALGEEELQDILTEQDSIKVCCEFCGEQYLFDRVDVETLLSTENTLNPSETRH